MSEQLINFAYCCMKKNTLNKCFFYTGSGFGHHYHYKLYN